MSTNSLPFKLQSRAEEIPQFVKDFAPLVFLDEKEEFFPSDIAKHLENTAPFIDLNPINPAPSVTVENLDILNSLGNSGENVFLTSKEIVDNKPAFLAGVQPDETGKTVDATTCAIIVTDHGDGTVDAFYMYFYSFDRGNTVLFQELGNHVGDWEHNMIRFKNGVPDAVWYSQHSSGQAFAFNVLEKQGNRPIVFSARGTHANYAIDGDHDHTFPGLNLPKGPLEDHTSRGKLWDPVKSAFFYTFNPASETFASVNNSPLGIMNFKGRWGDAQYPDGANGQRNFFGFKKYTSGPTGPRNKNLNRKNVCPDNVKDCKIRDKLVP